MASPGAKGAQELRDTIMRIRDSYRKAYFAKFGVQPSPAQLDLVVMFTLNEHDIVAEELLR